MENELSKFSNQSNNEIDFNLPVRSTCKYYTVNEFQKLNKTNNLYNFHTNINELEAKFSMNSFQMSMLTWILTITETSHKNEEFFIKNISLQGYNGFYTPSNSNKGGTAIYVKGNYDVFERTDLKFLSDVP